MYAKLPQLDALRTSLIEFVSTKGWEPEHCGCNAKIKNAMAQLHILAKPDSYPAEELRSTLDLTKAKRIPMVSLLLEFPRGEEFVRDLDAQLEARAMSTTQIQEWGKHVSRVRQAASSDFDILKAFQSILNSILINSFKQPFKGILKAFTDRLRTSILKMPQSCIWKKC